MSLFTHHHPHYPPSEMPFGTPHMLESFQVINPNPALSSLPPAPSITATPSTPSTLHVKGSGSSIPLTPVSKIVKADSLQLKRESQLSAAEIDRELELGSSKMARTEDIWKELLGTAKGRDKAFKVIQYAMRVYLLIHARTLGLLLSKTMWKRGANALAGNFQIAIGAISLSRKNTIMFNWLEPLIKITRPPSLPFTTSISLKPTSAPPPPRQRGTPSLLHRFLHAPPPLLLDLSNSIADDIYTLSRLSLLPRSIGRRADRTAQWCWFFSTLVGLVETGSDQGMVHHLMKEVGQRIYEGEVEGKELDEGLEIEEGEIELERLKAQLGWIKVTRLRLVMDLIFVSYDLFKFKRMREPVMAVTGLLAGILSTSELYDKHKQNLLKSTS